MGMSNEFLEFDEQPSKGRTKIWSVSATISCAYLGEIRWRSGWRKYIFAPDTETEYEQDCMRTIADFIENETNKQRATWKRPPK